MSYRGLKKYRYLLTFILILNFGTVIAHQDFWVTRDFSNVKVRITTGFKYEEINKVFIIGQLTEKLVQKLDYKTQIFLDFKHDYTYSHESDYLISFDNGNIKNFWENNEKEYLNLKGNSLIIKQIDRYFDAETTLKLVEMAIKNLTEIRMNAGIFEYNKAYCEMKRVMDRISISQSKSQEVRDVMTAKIYRPENEDKFDISYFWEKGKFNIFNSSPFLNDEKIPTFDNIYELKRFDDNTAIVFDTDSSFHFIDYNKENISSKKHIIFNHSDLYNHYIPHNIKKRNDDYITVTYTYIQDFFQVKKERVLVYLIEKDELIQDIGNSKSNSEDKKISDSLHFFTVDDYPIKDEMFRGNYGPKMSGEVVSFNKVWFSNQSLNQTMVFEPHTDFHRLVTFHFHNENLPLELIKRMQLHNGGVKLVTNEEKYKSFDGFIKQSIEIDKSNFISAKGVFIGMDRKKAIEIYGNPVKQEFIDTYEILEWEFIGDVFYDDTIQDKKKKIALDSFGHSVTMFFKNNRLVGQILFNDIP